MKVICNAKINLSLDIVGVRSDGYHNLRTVMQSVSLADTLTVTLAPNGQTTVTCSRPHIPTGADSLVHRSAAAILTSFPGTGAKIHIEKHIPVGAGLGGGSADAAGTMWAINELLNRPFTQPALHSMGAKLGADVPFCLMAINNRNRAFPPLPKGGCHVGDKGDLKPKTQCLAEGIGERLTPLSQEMPPHCVIAKPRGISVSTADAYKWFDQLSPKTIASANALEAAVLPRYPAIARCKQEFAELGAAFVLMSGSGSSVFALFTSPADAQTAYDAMKGSYDAYLCEFA